MSDDITYHEKCTPETCIYARKETLMPPKDTDDTIPDLPSPSQAPPGKVLKEVPFLTEAADFSTIAGAAKFWYNQYLEANGARTRIKIVCAVAGMLAGWGAASLWQYLSS